MTQVQIWSVLNVAGLFGITVSTMTHQPQCPFARFAVVGLQNRRRISVASIVDNRCRQGTRHTGTGLSTA